MKTIKSLLQWAALFGMGYLIFKGWSTILSAWRTLPALAGYQVVLFGLSLAFLWVEVMKWGVIKPFNCMKCMTGWLCFLLAIFFHTSFWYFYLPLGLFVGAMWSAVKMRWL